MTLDELRQTVAGVIRDLRCGKCDPKRAAEVANLARVQLKVIQAYDSKNPGIDATAAKTMTKAELVEKVRTLGGAIAEGLDPE